MPLIQSSSKKALKKNIETEMKANPMKKDQDLAIAYSIQRKNKKAKAMAEGGEVDSASEKNEYPSVDEQNQLLKEGEPLSKMYNPKNMAHGGEVEEHYASIADAILAKKHKAKAMADGGMVDLDENAIEGPDAMDEINVLGKENYSESLDSMDEPMDSNEHGDALDDEDGRDRVGAIRKKMKKLG